MGRENWAAGAQPLYAAIPQITLTLWVTFIPKANHKVPLQVEIQNPCSLSVPS